LRPGEKELPVIVFATKEEVKSCKKVEGAGA
jgi:hypothetical protein